jgi:hypothetical protein
LGMKGFYVENLEKKPTIYLKFLMPTWPKCFGTNN